MLEATQLRNNTLFVYQKSPCRVLKYKHTHMGRGGADIRIKARNLQTGAVLNLNFGSNDRFEEVNIEKRKMQYLYQEGENFFFMDTSSFEQIEVSHKIIGNSAKFLKEGELINIVFWENKPLDIDMPASIVVEIGECDPGVKGNSATNIYKSAVAKNGFSIKVPLFIKPGDKVKIDTESGEYIERT